MRTSPLIEYGSTALIIIIWVGAITAFFAAICGLLQNDLKRIIAFSTISQMGYLFIAVGLSQYNVALFHLVNHAFFKALLFLAAGAIIHAMGDQQDVRKLGGLFNFLPLSYSAILIGSLSLMALPWLTGFYSKDLIIELAYAQYLFSGGVAYCLSTLTAILTAFYSFRLISLVFFSYPNALKFYYLFSSDASPAIIISLFVLSIFSIFFGYIFADLFVGIGTDFFGNSLFIHPDHILNIEAEFGLSLFLKLIPTVGSVLAAVVALLMYHNKLVFFQFSNLPNGVYFVRGFSLREKRRRKENQFSVFDKKLIKTNTNQRKLYQFLNGKFLIEILYNNYIISSGLQMGFNISKILDRGIVELVGPFGLSCMLSGFSNNIAKLDDGLVTNYALYMVLGLLLILFLLINPLVNIISFGFYF